MAEASIPVHLFNPGQVFACLGFLEAAEVLLGDAEGRFDWSKEANIQFYLKAGGEENPFAVVLGFLAEAHIRRLAPHGYTEDSEKTAEPVEFTKTFPRKEADKYLLPILLASLRDGQKNPLSVSHWGDGSGREPFKFFGGQQRGEDIVADMLGKKESAPGLESLWREKNESLTKQPFGELVPLSGSFGFDPRRSWNRLDVGYAPNHQKNKVFSSPIVEILTAIGFEYARPNREKDRVQYAAWSKYLPPLLARPVLAGATLAIPRRDFVFQLVRSGKNYVFTFAREEL